MLAAKRENVEVLVFKVKIHLLKITDISIDCV